MKVGMPIERTGLAKETVSRAGKDEAFPSCGIRTLEIIVRLEIYSRKSKNS